MTVGGVVGRKERKEGKRKVRFISCALWFLMMAFFGVTVICGRPQESGPKGLHTHTHFRASTMGACRRA